MLGNYYADEFSNCPGPGFEEFPSHDPAEPPPAVGPLDDAGPEEATRPEQVCWLAHDNEPDATVKTPVVMEGRRKPRRSSAPPVLSVQNARVRKRSSFRRGSKSKVVPATESDLEELQKDR